MLKVRKINYRPWPVTVILQDCDGATGEVTEASQTFVAHFKPFDQDALDAARKKAEEAHPKPEGLPDDKLPMGLMLQRNAVFFAELICGWGDEVVDEEGRAIPYSADSLAALVVGHDGIPVSAGINNAILELQYGLAPQKNSKTSPSSGPSAGEGEAKTSSPTT